MVIYFCSDVDGPTLGPTRLRLKNILYFSSPSEIKKEENAFWEKLKSKVPFDENKTLLIDDNLTVLRTAREFGIKHLLTVAKPNSQKPNQNSEEFEAVYSFDGIVF